MTDYITVKTLSKYQHYKNRTPPWIKLHRDILNDFDFSQLPSASKAHLMLIWLLASQMDNHIPSEPAWIASRIGETKPIDLKPLISGGFITLVHDDSNTQADCKQGAIAEREREREREAERETEERQRQRKTEKKMMSDSFDTWWTEYPKKVSRKEALGVWMRMRPDAELLIATIKLQVLNDRQYGGDPKFIPGAPKYLRGEKWNDAIQQKHRSKISEGNMEALDGAMDIFEGVSA